MQCTLTIICLFLFKIKHQLEKKTGIKFKFVRYKLLSVLPQRKLHVNYSKNERTCIWNKVSFKREKKRRKNEKGHYGFELLN